MTQPSGDTTRRPRDRAKEGEHKALAKPVRNDGRYFLQSIAVQAGKRALEEIAPPLMGVKAQNQTERAGRRVVQELAQAGGACFYARGLQQFHERPGFGQESYADLGRHTAIVTPFGVPAP